jgi:hypothetical protein
MVEVLFAFFGVLPWLRSELDLERFMDRDLSDNPKLQREDEGRKRGGEGHLGSS